MKTDTEKMFGWRLTFDAVYILLPKKYNMGWVTNSHNISFDLKPTFFINLIAYNHGYIQTHMYTKQVMNKAKQIVI